MYNKIKNKYNTHLTAIFQDKPVSRYHNLSILNFIACSNDEGGGGDSWSCKACEAPARSSPPTNQHLYRPGAHVAQPTVSKQ